MERKHILTDVWEALKIHPVVAILGPRQCGKTTLAKQLQQLHGQKHPFFFFDLERPKDLARLDEPMLALQDLQGYIVIDEIQRRPELFPVLRVLVDEKKKRRFLILGSASRDLLRQSSETLAGRIRYLELTPFGLDEVDDLARLWLRGGFPPSYLLRSTTASLEWREAYVSTFLERDIPNLGIGVPAPMLRRFWMMLAHYHGNIFNASEVGKSLGVAHTTARHYLDILTGTFMMRELQPWFENISKRQVKASKIYFRDSGIFHTLLGITDRHSLLTHPKLGASWEGLALEEVIKKHRARPEECYFWAVHNQAELDLLLIKAGKRLGFEIKYSDAPKCTKSMQQARELLQLDSLTVIIPGKEEFPLGEGIQAVGLESYRRIGKTSV